MAVNVVGDLERALVALRVCEWTWELVHCGGGRQERRRFRRRLYSGCIYQLIFNTPRDEGKFSMMMTCDAGIW